MRALLNVKPFRDFTSRTLYTYSQFGREHSVLGSDCRCVFVAFLCTHETPHMGYGLCTDQTPATLIGAPQYLCPLLRFTMKRI